MRRGTLGRSDMPDTVRLRNRFLSALLIAASLLVGAAQAADVAAQKHPDVIAATVQARPGDTFDFDVTVSSPYDTPRRYADAFRVAGEDGAIFGERRLLHDHAGEQPFMRDLYGIKIPPGVCRVVIQARDQKYGYGGRKLEVLLPGR